jgi:hypothetical protein
MAAFAWTIRAKELRDEADVLYQEGVSAEEVMRLTKLGRSRPRPVE